MPANKGTILFVHGMCHGAWCWEPYFLPYFEQLGYHCSAINLRGHEQPGSTVSINHIGIEDYVADLQKAVSLLCEPPIIIGHSMGGYVAVALSRLMGDKLKGLCMMHSHPFEDLPTTKDKRSKAITFIEEHGLEKFLDMVVPTFFAPALQEKYKHVTTGLIAEAAMLSSQAVINGMDAMRLRPDMRAWVEELTCPYHCILGTEDIPTPLAFCIPQITLADITKVTILDGVGHMGMFSAKEEVQTALKDFIHFCTNRIS